MNGKKVQHLTATQLIALSFVGLILLGTLLLNLPIASKDQQSVGFLNALFTATSASCVTGLVVVNTLAHWTLFGQLVIISLIQLGALGFISIFSASLLLFNRRISLENRVVIKTAFGQDRIGGMGAFIKRVVQITLGIELSGAILLTVFFHQAQSISWGKAAYQGVFHAISAFCNAGFDILGNSSLQPFQGNWPIILTVSALIVLGGLGFPVIIEFFKRLRSKRQWSVRRRLQMLSVHAKIVLVMTGGLLLVGTLVILGLEWQNPATLGPLSWGNKILNAFFQSVTLRTAGYFSIDQAGLTDLSKGISSMLMLVGGSPAGTAGGIKTVSIALILIAVHAAIKGRSQLVAFHRTLPLQLLQKALTVVSMFVLLVLGAVVILTFSEQNSGFSHNLLDLIFEVSSALGTVGLTTGITPHLSEIGKIVIALCMFIGRLSPITVMVALTRQMNQHDVRYPSATVMIG
ncbi:TrkH family potassium uptake protein [Lapidilactobacillus achengensis]|uniref:TrkH family potassium uptake protein n=1 Tax=Lapidilactobacillus achengensis TaxID=2486000 RepID=A0ABW1USI5_9LACO|nr:potassium transporter TrkG [Lapidilactobacillus achengensis]